MQYPIFSVLGKQSPSQYNIIICIVFQPLSCLHATLDFPSNGEVRLHYSYSTPFYHHGLVEVYLSEEWGRVANDGLWTIEDGEVVCRELGFEIPSKYA